MNTPAPFPVGFLRVRVHPCDPCNPWSKTSCQFVPPCVQLRCGVAKEGDPERASALDRKAYHRGGCISEIIRGLDRDVINTRSVARAFRAKVQGQIASDFPI